MNIQLKDVDNVVFNGIDVSAVKFNDVLVWRKWEIIEYTGAVPVSFVAAGEPLIDCYVKGNMEQKSDNLFDVSKLSEGTSGFYINEDGTTALNGAWSITQYIPVSGDYVTLYGPIGNSPSICAYDENKQYIRGKRYANTTPTTLSIEGASYVRFSLAPSAQSHLDAMLNYGTSSLPFKPYSPSPTGTITPVETGKKTENLCPVSQFIKPTTYPTQYYPITFDEPLEAGTYTIKADVIAEEGVTEARISFRKADKTQLQAVNIEINNGVGTVTFTLTDIAYFVYFYGKKTASDVAAISYSNLMLNIGSTALPYEPYGYKIPISSGNTTTPVYLGEVETERKIKKLVLTGEETWYSSSRYTGSLYAYFSQIPGIAASTPMYCSHLRNVTDISQYQLGTCFVDTSSISLWMFDTVKSPTAFKSYLAQQYANGTPVCIWYVLSTPQTAVVNEPLRKIGNYADTLSVSQTIPTVEGSNVIDVETTLKPSEVYIKYKGKST